MKHTLIILLFTLVSLGASAQLTSPLASTVAAYKTTIDANYSTKLTPVQINKLAAAMLILDSNAMLEFSTGTVLTKRGKKWLDKMADNSFVDGNAVSYQTLLYMTRRNMIKLDEYANPTPATALFLRNTVDYKFCLADAQQRYKQQSDIFRSLKIITQQDLTPPAHGVVDTVIDGTTYFRVLTWKGSAGYFQSIDPKTNLRYYESQWQYPLFVTVDPDLRKWYKQYGEGITTTADFSARLAQLLGMPPTTNNSYMIGLWVRYQDLFRPTFDSSISHTGYKKGLTPAYLNWLNGYFKGSYNQDTLFSNYPFTGLGYTYDCNPYNFSHIGLSEFITNDKTRQYVSFIYTTKEFFELLKNE